MFHNTNAASCDSYTINTMATWSGEQLGKQIMMSFVAVSCFPFFLFFFFFFFFFFGGAACSVSLVSSEPNSAQLSFLLKQVSVAVNIITPWNKQQQTWSNRITVLFLISWEKKRKSGLFMLHRSCESSSLLASLHSPAKQAFYLGSSVQKWKWEVTATANFTRWVH